MRVWRSVPLLSLQGPFERVLGFLRALERLQVFVIINDLSVEAEPTPSLEQTVAEDAPPAPPQECHSN